ncbi:MAG: FIST N-terminal domain-containing protein [Pseudomonadota bacterium]
MPAQGPDFVAIHLDAAVPRDQILALAAAAGVRTLHGSTSCRGAMINAGIGDAAEKSVGLFAIWDPDGDFGTACVSLGDDPEHAGADAARNALLEAGRMGEAPALVWVSSSPGSEERVLAGIQRVLGTGVPIVGGSCADNDISGKWAVFDANRVEGAGVTVSVLFPSTDVSMSFQSGYAPTGTSGVITAADGRRIIEIDGRPALEIYDGWTSGSLANSTDASVQILSQSTFAPLGRQIENVASVPFYLLVHPAMAHPDGSIDVFANVAVGEELHLMTGSENSLCSRAGRVASQAREDLDSSEPVAGALVVYCAGCMLAVEHRMKEVASAVDTALDGAPFMGVFTFGEQGPVLGSANRHGNLMISCITFAA